MAKIYLLLIGFIFSLMACKKENKVSIIEPQLPPYTETGANTMGAIVNGKVLLPKSNNWRTPITRNYQGITFDTISFTLGFKNDQTKEMINFEGTFLRKEGKEIEAKTYPLGFYNNIYSEDKYFIKTDTILVKYRNRSLSNDYYYCYPEKGFVGELTIKKVDKEKQIISGTFWFNAISLTGQVVEVKDGRFDVVYNM